MTAVGGNTVRCPSCGASVAVGVARCSYCDSVVIVESGAPLRPGVAIMEFAQIRRDYSDEMNGGLLAFSLEEESIFVGADGRPLSLHDRHRLIAGWDGTGAYGLQLCEAGRSEYVTRLFRGSTAADDAHDAARTLILQCTDYLTVPDVTERRTLRILTQDEPLVFNVNERATLGRRAEALATVVWNLEANEALDDEIDDVYWEPGDSLDPPRNLSLVTGDEVSAIDGGELFFVVEYFPLAQPIIEGAGTFRIDLAALDACRNASPRQRQRVLITRVGYA